MDRRQFLRLGGAGIVASATMAEAGILSEFMSWLTRKPAWSFPTNTTLERQQADFHAALIREYSIQFESDEALMRALQVPVIGKHIRSRVPEGRLRAISAVMAVT
jgi:hypothetical protein